MNSGTEFILQIEDINKYFPGVHALKDVSFKIRKNTIHGLVGENGAGKSTLIKVLSGVYKSDSGSIFLEGNEVKFETPKDSFRAGISTIYQELSVINDLTVSQDMFFGYEKQFMKYGFINYKKMNKAAAVNLSKIGFNLDVTAKVETLSVSQKQQLEIAKSLMKNTKIILMDEPTSALTKNEVEKLFHDIQEIKQRGVSIIYISHHLDEVFEICDYVTVLKDGAVVDTEEIKKLNKPEVVKMMVGKDIAGITTNRYRELVSDMVVLDVKNYSTSTGVKNVNFQLHLGEVLGIYGALGSRRTELLKSLYTGMHKTGGECSIRSKKLARYGVRKSIEEGMGFLPEDRKEEGNFLNLPILKNIPFIFYNKQTVFGFLRRKLGLKDNREICGGIKNTYTLLESDSQLFKWGKSAESCACEVIIG